MTVLAPVDTDPVVRFQLSHERCADPEEPSALLAQHIVQRALRDLSYLQEVPAHIRAHRDWFRSAVIVPLIQSITAPDGQQIADMRSAVVMQAPEFLADAEVRRHAGMGPLRTDGEKTHMVSMARRQETYPSGVPVEGAPITDEDPALVGGYPLMNGSTRSGTCDVCGADGLLTYEATLAVHQHIQTLQLRTCARCEEQLAGDGPRLTRTLYEKARFS